MRSEALLLYFTLLQIAGAGFPEDSEPISISHGNCKYIFSLCFSSLSFGLNFSTSGRTLLSFQVGPFCSPSFSFTLFRLLYKSTPSRYLSHLFYPFTIPHPSQPLPLPQPPPPLKWTHSEGMVCKLVPKDRPSTHTKMKDLRQHLKRSPPHIKG